MSRPRIYLDYNATSPVRTEVRAAVEPILFGAPEAGAFGNASSVHWAGQAARRYLEGARFKIAQRLNRKPSEIVFTSGGSEADHLALYGCLERAPEPRRLVLTAVEHPAVDATARTWAGRGVEVLRLAPTPSGGVDLDALTRALDPKPSLVSVMAVNNETGIVHDLPAVRALTGAAGVPLHVDAVQAAGRLPLEAWDGDLVVLSGHKLGALPGVGVLAIREDLALSPVLVGGPQERGRRAGTEAVAAAVSVAVALAVADDDRVEEQARLTTLRNHLEEGLRGLPGASIIDDAPRVAGVSCVVFDDVDGEVLLQALDLEGVAVSSGSACSSGSLEPSHVLLALGVPASRALSALRFSLGRGTTPEEIERVRALMPELLARARG